MGKLKELKYTLVEHSGWSTPGFERAVEEAAITTTAELARVQKAGGVVYDSYTAAADAEDATNYPPGTEGIYPRAVGRFVNVLIGERRLFVPETAGPRTGNRIGNPIA
jgi:hypothetical protein